MKPRDLGYIALIIFALNLGVGGLRDALYTLNNLALPSMGQTITFSRFGIGIAAAAVKLLAAYWILTKGAGLSDRLFARLSHSDNTESKAIYAFDMEKYLYVGIVLTGVFLFFAAIATMISSIGQFLQFSGFETSGTSISKSYFLVSAFFALFTPVPSLLLLMNARLIARKLAIRFETELPPVDSMPE